MYDGTKTAFRFEWMMASIPIFNRRLATVASGAFDEAIGPGAPPRGTVTRYFA